MCSVEESRLELLVRERFRRKGGAIRPLCLFLGAGADIGSGGLTFNQFKQRCYEFINNEPSFSITSELETETFFQKIFNYQIPFLERARFVEAIFRWLEDAHPSDSYKLLALLIRFSGLDAIITTNFDVMLETAADRLGGRYFDVFAPGIARPDQYALGTGFASRRCPYIKMHGDLAAGIVTKLTSTELDLSDYDTSLTSFVQNILRTHTLVFSGYSGFDSALAEVIGNAVSSNNQPIFWCQPTPPCPDSALLKKIAREQVVHVAITFEKCIAILARPVLEKPIPLPNQSGFLPSLIEWRAAFSNREFLNEFAFQDNRDLTNTFIRRSTVENDIKRFLHSSHNLAAIVGPSGYGKTTTGIRLHSELWDPSRRSWILLLKSQGQHTANFDDIVVDRLGINTADYASLFNFEKWLQKESRSLVLFVDAINEYSSKLEECLQFVRGILRLAYILPEHSRIKIIITARHETWTGLLRLLDRAQLASALWSGTIHNTGSIIAPININRFTPEELRLAIKELNRAKLVTFKFDDLLPQQQERLRDPFLLRTVVESARFDIHSLTGPGLYQAYFENKLKRITTTNSIAQIVDSLSELAALCFSRRTDLIRPLDIDHLGPFQKDLDRILKDTGILVDTEDGYLRFSHERTQQYFLYLAFGRSPNVPSLECLEDLESLLKNAYDDNKILVAARLYIYTKRNRFSIIEDAFSLSYTDSLESDRLNLFHFCKEVILEAAREEPSFLARYAMSVVLAAQSPGKISSSHLRTVIQAAVILGPEAGVAILVEALKLENEVASLEASIYLNDLLATLFLRSSDEVDLLESPYFQNFFNDMTVPIWRRIARLVVFSSAVGPDNTHPTEYDRFVNASKKALQRLWSLIDISYDDILKIAELINNFKDRFLFNSLDDDLEHFFKHTDRSPLISWLNRIEEFQSGLTLEDLKSIKPYMRSTMHHTSFLLNNILVSLAAGHDFESFKKVWCEWVEPFNTNPEPEEVDFFTGIICYAYIVNNEPYDSILDNLIEHILFKVPRILNYNPGISRGLQRGFTDRFDMEFEDGFNPIASYLFMAPCRRRQNLSLIDYERRTTIESERLEQIGPLFESALQKYLEQDDIPKVNRILHAIGQTISLWPIEGLACLKGVVGLQDRIFRRALTRLLAESYARHPLPTQRFLEREQGTFSPKELNTIQGSFDSRLGRRQFETVEWARILHFLICRLPQGRDRMIQVLRVIYRSNNLKEAVENSATVLGVYQPGLK